MSNSLIKNILLITIFGIAMAALESAVVVYLRELYYPEGFTVKFMDMPSRVIIVELFRELGTLVMLISIAWLAGKTRLSRFAWFIFTFAVWDIFYYVWLKIFINWPLSLLDWDILFLLPITWLGPVIAPVICSLTMIILSMFILFDEEGKLKFRLTKLSWLLIITGAVIIFGTFIRDYTGIIIQNGFCNDLSHILQNPAFFDIAKNYIPESFSWGWFLAGELLISAGIANGLINKR